MSPEYLTLLKNVAAFSIVCLLAHWPSNWMIKRVIKKWRPEPLDSETVSDKMGAFIGTLERILIIVLVGLGSYAAVGFVGAMKSIARYEKIQKERAFAEYFLAGTMLSILLALLLALIAKSASKLAIGKG